MPAWRCEFCGAVSNIGIRPANHKCNTEKFIEYQMKLFDQGFKTFIQTPNGRWLTYYAKWLISQGSVQASPFAWDEPRADYSNKHQGE